MAVAISCRRYQCAVTAATELIIIRDYLSQANCGWLARFFFQKKCVNPGYDCKNLENTHLDANLHAHIWTRI